MKEIILNLTNISPINEDDFNADLSELSEYIYTIEDALINYIGKQIRIRIAEVRKG